MHQALQPTYTGSASIFVTSFNAKSEPLIAMQPLQRQVEGSPTETYVTAGGATENGEDV